MKKLLPLVLIAAVIVSLSFLLPDRANAATYSGSCGTNGNWSLDTSTGVLSITGSGAMTNYALYSAPWYSYRTSVKSVTIGNGVTRIGNNAFEGCGGLASITIPDSVTSIGTTAFLNCRGLTSIAIPNSVTSIANSAFSGCTGLTSITIPDSVTSIWGSAFSGCTGLTSITIPDSVTSIGNFAFSSCTGLTTITIPDSVTSIEEGTFSGCSRLTSITIPDSVTSIGDSAFYNCKGLTSITIPDSVTSIGSWVFSGDTNLNYNTYKNAKYLGNSENPYYALISVTNTSITSCTIHSNTKVIANRPFSDCSKLTSVTIPDGVTSIGNEAFSGTKLNYNTYNNAKYLGSLENLYLVLVKASDTSISSCNIHAQTKIIYGSAFSGCSRLTSITIPDSVTSIGDSAFYNCKGLTSITIPDSVTSIGDSAFSGCSGLTSITIPASVTSIGAYAFSGCTGLTSITIPNSVTSIGDSAFRGCMGLTSITIPDSVTSIGEEAFYGCSVLTSITIPASVTSIGVQAFSYCTGLTSITIPDSVVSIGDSAFYNCKGLTFITIPDSVTSIGYGAFSGCSGLTSISVVTGNTVYHSAGNCLIKTASKTLIRGFNNSVIPSDGSVTSIGDSAFSGCTGLTTIAIPESVVSIGDSAFSYCTGLTSITIPESVVSIGDSAFEGCKGLTRVDITDLAIWCGIAFNRPSSNPLYNAHNLYLNGSLVTALSIPAGVTSIGSSAFSGCTGLTSITIPDSVTSIGGSAFWGCTSLTSITIPDSVTSIGGSAFSGCSSLESMTIPFVGGSRKTASDTWQYPFGYIFGTNSYTGGVATYQAYYGSSPSDSSTYYIPSSLKSVTVTGGEILRGAFQNCANLTSIIISDGVTSIGNEAFKYCSGLTSVTIPDSVTSIGSAAFCGCSSLKSLTIPFVGGSRKTASETYQYPFGYIFGTSSYTGGVATTQTYYGSSTSSTTSTTYYIPASLKSVTVTGGNILYGAFYNCTGLTTITIPGSVTRIENYAFNNCSKLKTVHYLGSPWKNAIAIGSYNVPLRNATWITKQVSTFDIQSYPVKLQYEIGEVIDTTGLSFHFTFDDASTEVITNGFTTSGFSSTTTGTKTVTVTFEGYSCTYDVTVVKRLSSIAVKTQPTKTQYEVGDVLNTTGIVLTLTYNDGTTEDVTEGFAVSGFSSDLHGEKTVTVAYEGFEVTFSVTVHRRPVSLTVQALPEVTEYKLDETFRSNGLALLLTYNDGTAEVLSSGFTLSEPDLSVYGEKTVTATVHDEETGNDWTASFAIQVYRRVASAAIHQPDKKQYAVGEELDLTGLYLLFSYTDGSSETVYDGFAVSGFDSALGGEKTVTVSYHLYDTSFKITVVKELVSVSIQSEPNKKEYEVGEELNTAGLSLLLRYNDGTTEIVTEGFETFGFDSALGGEKTVTVTYEGFENAYLITVIKRPSSLAVQTLVTKDQYEVGEALDVSGLVLTLTYNDGTTETVTEGFVTSGFDSAKGGVKTIEVTSSGVSTTFTVEVIKRLNSSSILSMPDKTEYKAGEAADFTGMSVTLSYNDGTSETVISGFVSPDFDTSAVGAKTVTVQYGSFMTFFDITVKGVTEISIKTAPIKSQYEVGEALDITGLVLTLTYSDNSAEDVTTGFTVSGFDSGKAGTKTVTVTFSGFTVSFDVTVVKRLSGIEVKTAPTKNQYEVGETLDTAGLILTLTYNDGSTEDVTTGFTVSGFDSIKAGTKTVTVAISGFTVSFNVTVVKRLSDIEVKTAPTKNQYEVGEALDTAGLTLTLTYNDGSLEEISTGFTTSGFDSSTVGKKMITVRYEGFTTVFEVTVKANSAPFDPSAPLVRIDQKTIHADETAELSIALENAPTISSLSVSGIQFKNEYFELISVEWIVPETKLKNYDFDTETGAAAFDAKDANGGILKLTFKAIENVPDGEYSVSCVVSAKNGSQVIPVQTVGGQITITSALPGDADGDEVVTDADAIYVLMHTFFPDLYPIEDESAFDFDGDGVVTDADAIYLLMYTFFPEMYPIALPPKQTGV